MEHTPLSLWRHQERPGRRKPCALMHEMSPCKSHVNELVGRGQAGHRLLPCFPLMGKQYSRPQTAVGGRTVKLGLRVALYSVANIRLLETRLQPGARPIFLPSVLYIPTSHGSGETKAVKDQSSALLGKPIGNRRLLYASLRFINLKGHSQSVSRHPVSLGGRPQPSHLSTA